MLRTVLSVVLPTWLMWCSSVDAQQTIPIGPGWARTKVNAVIFRHNAICSHQDTQYAAYYNAERQVVLCRRTLGTEFWESRVTQYTGRVADAHNCISIAVDGDGFLHMSWDHHGDPLRYCRSSAPGSLELTDRLPMTGSAEDRVTYPEFYLLPGGDLLFFYRDGASGNGDLVLNRYDVRTRQWHRVQSNLVSGEGHRNAYWQVSVDRMDDIHLSWVWRETGDVVTNHDICYARSTDGGITWQRTDGRPYQLPITEATAEYAVRIPQNSELANQTSMAVDSAGHPWIANFWRDAPQAVPQYRVVRHDGTGWQVFQVGQRTLDFHRRGGGTKRPPVSRPVILLDSSDRGTRAFLMFRDLERGGGISVAATSDPLGNKWQFHDLTAASVGQADPVYDPVVWATRRRIHLLTQFVGQGDGEKQEEVAPQMVSVVEWTPPDL